MVIDFVLEKGKLNQLFVNTVKNYIFDGQDVRCCFCNRLLTRKTATIEHIIPKCMLDYCDRNNINNLAISCEECNANRKVADFEEYRQYAQKKREELPEGSRQRIVNAIHPTIKNEIVYAFSNGISISDLQSQYNVSKRTITQILKKAGYDWTVIQYAKRAI